MTSLASIKRRINDGDIVEVTNHYITRPDHPCYGTRRGVVARITSTAFYLYHGDKGGSSRIEWPKAAQVRAGLNSFDILGGGVAQGPMDPFLTVRHVSDLGVMTPCARPADLPADLAGAFQSMPHYAPALAGRESYTDDAGNEWDPLSTEGPHRTPLYLTGYAVIGHVGDRAVYVLKLTTASGRHLHTAYNGSSMSLRDYQPEQERTRAGAEEAANQQIIALAGTPA
jgi:hypothetical protein